MLYISTVNYLVGSALLALPLLFIDSNAGDSEKREEDFATHHTGTHSAPTPSTPPRPSTPKPRMVADLADEHAGAAIDAPEGFDAKVRACATDGDCKLHSNYCNTCECLAMPVGDTPPTCKDPIACLRDPCQDKKAVCSEGKCVASEAPLNL